MLLCPPLRSNRDWTRIVHARARERVTWQFGRAWTRKSCGVSLQLFPISHSSITTIEQKERSSNRIRPRETVEIGPPIDQVAADDETNPRRMKFANQTHTRTHYATRCTNDIRREIRLVSRLRAHWHTRGDESGIHPRHDATRHSASSVQSVSRARDIRGWRPLSPASHLLLSHSLSLYLFLPLPCMLQHETHEPYLHWFAPRDPIPFLSPVFLSSLRLCILNFLRDCSLARFFFRALFLYVAVFLSRLDDWFAITSHYSYFCSFRSFDAGFDFHTFLSSTSHARILGETLFLGEGSAYLPLLRCAEDWRDRKWRCDSTRPNVADDDARLVTADKAVDSRSRPRNFIRAVVIPPPMSNSSNRSPGFRSITIRGWLEKEEIRGR